METKSLREQSETIVADLKYQARVLGSSGKGYGDFARVNREAASLIQELLAQIETKDAAVNFWSAQYKMLEIEAAAYYSEMKYFEKKSSKSRKETKRNQEEYDNILQMEETQWMNTAWIASILNQHMKAHLVQLERT